MTARKIRALSSFGFFIIAARRVAYLRYMEKCKKPKSPNLKIYDRQFKLIDEIIKIRTLSCSGCRPVRSGAFTFDRKSEDFLAVYSQGSKPTARTFFLPASLLYRAAAASSSLVTLLYTLIILFIGEIYPGSSSSSPPPRRTNTNLSQTRQ